MPIGNEFKKTPAVYGVIGRWKWAPEVWEEKRNGCVNREALLAQHIYGSVRRRPSVNV
jgi:hypothetical protein